MYKTTRWNFNFFFNLNHFQNSFHKIAKFKDISPKVTRQRLQIREKITKKVIFKIGILSKLVTKKETLGVLLIFPVNALNKNPKVKLILWPSSSS